MMHENILSAIGNTPLVRLNRVGPDARCPIYAKLEYMNPGGSMKDRIGITMVDEAERSGKLKPGGTIIEGTSGNTGMGLALVAAVRGYKLIFTITDKQSREKIDALKAFGAEVIVCPTAVKPDDPRSYYSVAKKLAQEIPNSYYPNQYDNPANPDAHYRTTGPEIWKQTDGKVTHFVAGMGTGGTCSGTGKYLKERNPKVKVVGADPVGSLYYDYFHSGKVIEAHSYVVEGIGEDIFPSTMDFSVMDDVIQVTDKESFLWTRRLAREEGIFTGGSGGSAVIAAVQTARRCKEDDLVVVLIPDHGGKYLNKIYNDSWMRENRYLEPEVRITVGEVVRDKQSRSKIRKLLTARPQDTVMNALALMQEHDVSQLPVFDGTEPIGALYEDDILRFVLLGKDLKGLVVREVMGSPLPVVEPATLVGEVTTMLATRCPAVFVKGSNGEYGLVTKYDILHSVGKGK